jgi:hypothetical protein
MDASYPVDLIADLSPIGDTMAFTPTEDRDRIQQADPAIRKWERQVAALVDEWSRKLHDPSSLTPEDGCALAKNLAKKWSEMPVGEIRRVGMLDHDSLDDVRACIDEHWGGSEIDVTPTTLGRLTPQAALRLLVRGYVNTFVQSMFLESNPKPKELARLRSIQERFQRMIPALQCETNRSE